MTKINTPKKRQKRKRITGISVICWGFVPISLITLLILDGCGIYIFSTQRLVVIGAGVLVMLLPFFEEITIKNFSIKKDKYIKK